MKAAVTIEIDTDDLGRFTDEQIAKLWAVAQANPAPFGDPAACKLASDIGFEIIARWLKQQPPALYSHQQSHPYSKQRMDANAADPHALDAQP